MNFEQQPSPAEAADTKSSTAGAPADPSRRGFLQKAGIATRAVAAPVGVGYLIKEAVEQEGEKGKGEREKSEKQPPVLVLETKGIEDVPLSEVEPISGEEVFTEIARIEQYAVGQTPLEQLRGGAEKISLDAECVRAMLEQWKDTYRERSDIEDACARMYPWYQELAEHFAEEGVPEEFIHLAIVESGFKVRAVSRSGACGPYQFMSAMQDRFGMATRGGVDMRMDPGYSGRACAQHLHTSFEAFSEDWSLALADYNGSYTNNFRKNYGRPPKSWNELLEAIETDLNRDLAAQQDAEARQSHYDTSKYRENIEYPLKFYAVLSMLQEREDLAVALGNTEERPYYTRQSILREVQERHDFSYTIQRGDTLIDIARTIKENAEQRGLRLQFENNRLLAEWIAEHFGLDERALVPGTVLPLVSDQVRGPEKLSEVFAHSGHTNIDTAWIAALSMFNPSFQSDLRGQIPKEMEYIRVPTERAHQLVLRTQEKQKQA